MQLFTVAAAAASTAVDDDDYDVDEDVDNTPVVSLGCSCRQAVVGEDR